MINFDQILRVKTRETSKLRGSRVKAILSKYGGPAAAERLGPVVRRLLFVLVLSAMMIFCPAEASAELIACRMAMSVVVAGKGGVSSTMISLLSWVYPGTMRGAFLGTFFREISFQLSEVVGPREGHGVWVGVQTGVGMCGIVIRGPGVLWWKPGSNRVLPCGRWER